MTLRFGSIVLACGVTIAASLATAADASACGGCFQTMENTVVTSHRMALSISMTQSVLWDQIEYSGSPKDFAWVLPVKPGARVELSTDAWFEALDTATAARVSSPSITCDFGGDDEEDYSERTGCNGGCAKSFTGGAGGFDWRADESDAETPPVTVVHQETVGPYDSVVLHANQQGVLTDWLIMNGYKLDAEIEPLIDAYTAEGFDFIALRLQPNQGIQQMKPVRVVTPGADPLLPLRMVAAGTGANVTLTLFVIGEGRWETQNFPNGLIDPAALTWDFGTTSSDFAQQRKSLFEANEGRTWINSFAQQGALFGKLESPIDMSVIQYEVGTFRTASTIADLYVEEGLANLETDTDACKSAYSEYAESNAVVVDLCVGGGQGTGGTGGVGGAGGAGGAPGGGGSGGSNAGGAGGMSGPPCAALGADEIDARAFACGDLDDLATALVGMRPRDVWLTRLESNLPRAALKDDLVLQAAGVQQGVSNWFVAKEFVNPPCNVVPAGSVVAGGGGGPPRSVRNATVATVAAIAALVLAAMRRLARPMTSAPIRVTR